jgi:hypothetical protein
MGKWLFHTELASWGLRWEVATPNQSPSYHETGWLYFQVFMDWKLE